jgi:hypothetical protein
VYAIPLIVAIGASILLWLRARFAEDWALPHGIYASAQLVSAYHEYRSEHGRWPQPGTFVAKEVEYVRTFDQGKVRYDVFNFGGGQYVHLELFPDGRLIALPVKGDEQRPGGAP